MTKSFKDFLEAYDFHRSADAKQKLENLRRKKGVRGSTIANLERSAVKEEAEQIDENSGPFSSSDYMPGQRIGGANLPSASKKDTHVKTFTANREKEASEFAKKHGYTVKKHTYPAGHTNLHPHEYQVHKEEVEQIDELSKSTLGSYVKNAARDVGASRKLAADFENNAKSARKQSAKDANTRLSDKFKDTANKRHAGIGKAVERLTKEEIEQIEESMTDSWKRVQSMDKGSVTGGKDEVRKRLDYLSAVHDHHKKYGNDTKKVKSDIEKINRSRIAEELDEEVKTGNEGRGYHGEHPSGTADKKYSATHATVKKVAGEAGHLKTAKQPNTMVKHYLDSQHGRHLAGREGDHEYIKKDFGKFAKSYKPEMHESVELEEKAPPGFEGTVKAMKKHKEIDNPYALAWYLKNKGAKSHKNADGTVKKEEVMTNTKQKEDPPFDGPYKKKPSNVTDKSGAVHTPMSIAKHLARQAMKKVTKEEFELDEALDPSEIASNPRMYSADAAKKAYYHKKASESDKQSLAKHLDRHHGNKEWRKPVKEETELDESYAKVETKKYSWGTMKTAHHGSSFSVPMHPEHHKAIHGLKDNQEHKFKDETGRHWTAKRMGDDVHLHSANDGPKTKIKHSDLAEGVTGAVAGGIMGGIAGGPIGAVAGAYLGHKLQQGANAAKKIVKQKEKKQRNEEVEQIEERNKENATRRKMMDASRGARFKAQGNHVPDPEPEHKNAQAHNKAIGRAIRKMSNEHINFDDEGNIVSEKKSYADFMSLLEYETDKNGRYVHKGNYGTSYKDPEGADDADDKQPKKVGRKTGSKVGPKTNLGNSKLHQGK